MRQKELNRLFHRQILEPISQYYLLLFVIFCIKDSIKQINELLSEEIDKEPINLFKPPLLPLSIGVTVSKSFDGNSSYFEKLSSV